MDLFWNPWVIHFVEPAAKAVCHALALTGLLQRAHLRTLHPCLTLFLAGQCAAVACETAGWILATQYLWIILIPLKVATAFEILSRLSAYDARAERSSVALTGISIGTLVVFGAILPWHPWPGESWPHWIVLARIANDTVLLFAVLYGVLYFRFAFYVVARPPDTALAWIFAALMATALFKAVRVTDPAIWWVLHGAAIAWQCCYLLALRAAIRTPKFGTRETSNASVSPTPA